MTIWDDLNKLYGDMLRPVLLFFVFVFLPASAFCAIYGYVDTDGVYHMTNIRPAHKNYYTLIEDSNPPAAAGLGSFKANLNKNTYDDIIKVHSEANGVDPSLVKAVMIAESNANPRAVSNKGAQGLMQIMPDTASFLDLRNPFDPEENIQAGTRYLKMLSELFRGDLELVLAAYNAGPQRVMQHNMAIPPITETVNYVKRVKAYYSRLKDRQ